MAPYDDYDYPKYWDKRLYEHLSEVVVLKGFFAKIGHDKNIIDIGGGYGRLAKEYENFARKITLVDPSGALLARAKKFLGKDKKVSLVQSTIQNLPEKFDRKKFDVLVLVRVMHHIKDPKEAIKVAARHLPKGGYFILEFANKLHGKAILKNLLSGNFTFPLEIFPIDKRSKKNIKEKSILFLNHHPDVIEKHLKDFGFKIVTKRSVSNIRSKFIKQHLPLNILVRLEGWLQKPLAKFNFGPSIFILAKKK